VQFTDFDKTLFCFLLHTFGLVLSVNLTWDFVYTHILQIIYLKEVNFISDRR